MPANDYEFLLRFSFLLLVSLALTALMLHPPMKFSTYLLIIAAALGSGWLTMLPDPHVEGESMAKARFIAFALCIAIAVFVLNASDWRAAMSLVGAVFEVLGVFCMANGYLRLPRLQPAGSLVSALWRGRWAQRAANVYAFNQDRAMVSLQGLAFIGLGFVLQGISYLGALFAQEPS